MKLLLLFLLLSLRVFGATDEQLLQAIAMTENTTTVGRNGEVGPHQLTPATVRDHGLDPRNNLRWLKRELVKKKVDPSPFNLALCWNAGLTGATSGKAPLSSYEYANRVVANLELITHHGSWLADVSHSMTVSRPVVFTIKTP